MKHFMMISSYWCQVGDCPGAGSIPLVAEMADPTKAFRADLTYNWTTLLGDGGDDQLFPHGLLRDDAGAR